MNYSFDANGVCTATRDPVAQPAVDGKDIAIATGETMFAAGDHIAFAVNVSTECVKGGASGFMAGLKAGWARANG